MLCNSTKEKAARQRKVCLKVLTEKIINKIFREEVTFKSHLQGEEKERAFQVEGPAVLRQHFQFSVTKGKYRPGEQHRVYGSQDGAVNAMIEFGIRFTLLLLLLSCSVVSNSL